MVKDNLLLSKIIQGVQKNKHQSAEIHYRIGNQVMLSMFYCWQEYLHKGQNCVAKFMPRFDGPLTATNTFPTCSIYTITMPNFPETYPSFHAFLLKPFILNDLNLFPSRVQIQPGMAITEHSTWELYWIKVQFNLCNTHHCLLIDW